MKGQKRRSRERQAAIDEQRPVDETGEWALIWRFYFKVGEPEDRIMFVGTEADCLRLDDAYRVAHGWPIYHGWPPDHPAYHGDEPARLPVHAATMTRKLAEALADGAYDVRRNPEEVLDASDNE
jgi:hypothetical protein